MFFSYIKNCKPSKRNQLEITEINNFYLKDNKLNYKIIKKLINKSQKVIVFLLMICISKCQKKIII